MESAIELQEMKNDQITLARDTTPNGLLALAIQKDLDIEKLTKLMELQERWHANEAKKAFVIAMTEFKKNPPKIVKDMHVEFATSKGKTSYNHASLGNVVASVTEALSQHDMSVNWQTETKELVSVTCTITHVAGHSESTSISARPDESGGKNAIQAIGSTITYLQRYTLLAICGLATNEFEDDGRGGNKPEPKKAKVVYPPNVQKLIDAMAEKSDKLPEKFKEDVRAVVSRKTELTDAQLAEWLAAIKFHLTEAK